VTVRVAAVQFGCGPDVGDNLATVLQWVDRAAAAGAQIVVLPEFCNHPSIYDGAEHAFEVAIDVDGPWAAAVADRARRHGTAVMVNATVRRGRHPDGRPHITDSNLLYGPDGRLLARSDKHVLMGGEREHIDAGTSVCEVVELFGARVAMYSCMDGVINETPRCLALRGAQVLLNSLNSFALDEATLHIPVRAPENRVFVVAANKVGPLLPPAAARRISQGMGVPEERLVGAGESQVVAPDGTVLAKADPTEPDMVVVDLDPVLADDKRRPDGTDVFAARRPELYAAIGRPPTTAARPPSGAAELSVAAVTGAPDELAAMVAAVVADGVRLVVLPELAAHADGRADDGDGADGALVEALTAALRGTPAHAVVSIRDGDRHLGAVVGGEGLVALQPQLHRSGRHAGWHEGLGEGLSVVDLPWGRLAVVVGDDALYPETFRLAALAHAEVAAVPFTVLEAWEVRTGLLERAAENRLSVVAATRPTAAGASLVLGLHPQAALWGSREFDGTISFPLVTAAAPDQQVLCGVVQPAHAAHRLVSRGTDLVDGRPWQLVDAITGSSPVGRDRAPEPALTPSA
jgi:predicted amidohydrolase